MSSFDVRIFAIRRRPGRRVFEVRWRVAGCKKSRSFITRALADSYDAELVRNHLSRSRPALLRNRLNNPQSAPWRLPGHNGKIVKSAARHRLGARQALEVRMSAKTALGPSKPPDDQITRGTPPSSAFRTRPLAPLARELVPGLFDRLPRRSTWRRQVRPPGVTEFVLGHGGQGSPDSANSCMLPSGDIYLEVAAPVTTFLPADRLYQPGLVQRR